jgi:sugar phosphate isomerase/epimerase
MHRLSLAHLTIDHAEPLELIEAAARAGFDSVGLRVISAPGAPARAPAAGNPRLISRLAATAAENGLDVLQVNSFWITPETTASAFAPVIEAAARLQARNVLVVISDADLQRAAARFAECCAAAEPFGIGIALEFQSYSPVRTVEQAMRIIEASGFPNAGLVVDALHLDRGGGRPSDVAQVPPNRLHFVQLCDARAAQPPPDALRREARSGRLYPGEGELPLFELMDALPGGIDLDMETPHAGSAHLPIIEQALRAAYAARHFLSAYAQRAPKAGSLS